jgi:hypothetical protein
MDAAQASHEKRTINVKNFLDDFHSGVNNQNLMEKYNLTESGLATFYEMLEERGILKAQEIRKESWSQSETIDDSPDFSDEKSSYICPRCLASHDTMFDICPSCGVSFHELISQDKAVTASISTEDKNHEIYNSLTNAAESEEYGTARAEPAATSKELKRSAHSMEDVLSDDHIPRFQALDDSLDEILSAVPIDSGEESANFHKVPCSTCGLPMESGIRNIYDRTRALQALFMAGICFASGFLGIMALSLFQDQSLVRLVIFFSTVAVTIIGVISATAGAFLFLAREKVYICRTCHRAYPRI